MPDQMVGAHRSLLEVLEFRRDALDAIASRITAALSDDAEASDPAVAAIAGQMSAFLASDVIYDARVVPLIKQGLKDGDAGDQPVAASQFLPGVEWLSESYIADKLGAQAPAGGSAGSRGTPAPGLHGTGLQGVERGRRDARSPAARTASRASTRAFAVALHQPGRERRDRRARSR